MRKENFSIRANEVLTFSAFEKWVAYILVVVGGGERCLVESCQQQKTAVNEGEETNVRQQH